jgi:hypothetical protein
MVGSGMAGLVQGQLKMIPPKMQGKKQGRLLAVSERRRHVDLMRASNVSCPPHHYDKPPPAPKLLSHSWKENSKEGKLKGDATRFQSQGQLRRPVHSIGENKTSGSIVVLPIPTPYFVKKFTNLFASKGFVCVVCVVCACTQTNVGRPATFFRQRHRRQTTPAAAPRLA